MFRLLKGAKLKHEKNPKTPLWITLFLYVFVAGRFYYPYGFECKRLDCRYTPNFIKIKYCLY